MNQVEACILRKNLQHLNKCYYYYFFYLKAVNFNRFGKNYSNLLQFAV
jgi:hypothetical protein